jgi:hypothetical protein
MTRTSGTGVDVAASVADLERVLLVVAGDKSRKDTTIRRDPGSDAGRQGSASSRGTCWGGTEPRRSPEMAGTTTSAGKTAGSPSGRRSREGGGVGRGLGDAGGWRCDQIGRKRSDGVAMIEGAVTGGEEEVDAGKDSRAPRLDFLHAEMEENVRVLVVLSE